jgi:hypothetical protein
MTFHSLSCTFQPERNVEKSNENIQKFLTHSLPPPRGGGICEELEKGRYENVSNGGYGLVTGSV